MSQVTDSISIGVPPPKVLEALLDVANAPAWMPSLEKVWDIEGEGVGKRYKWIFKMAGLPFTGATEITAASEERFTFSTEGGIPSTWDWILSPTREGTHVKLVVDYAIPGGALGGLANRVIEQQNSKEMQEGLVNLKALLEKVGPS